MQNQIQMQLSKQQYPEHEKLNGRQKDHEAICDFLEFIEGKGHSIIHYIDVDPDDDFTNPVPMRSSKDDIIAGFFGIDRQKFAEEKDQMFRSLANL